MIGQTIEAKSPLSKGACFWLLIAAVFCAFGISEENPHLGIAALFPLLMSATLWLRRPAEVIFTVEEHGLMLIGSQKRIDYQAIKNVYLNGTPFRQSTKLKAKNMFYILYDKSVLLLPERMSVCPQELGLFLIDRIPTATAKELHPTLVEYAGKQIAKFGADKITCFHQREYQLPIAASLTSATFGKVFVSCGVLWNASFIVAAFFDREDVFLVWIGPGASCLFLGALLWLLGRSRSRGVSIDVKKHGAASMVISPAGIGLAQSDLKGKLRWEEITKINNSTKKHFRHNNKPGLHLHIAGGVIVIVDVYDQSLMEIASLITKNRQQPGG